MSPAGWPQGKGIVVRGNSICNSMELQKILTRNAHCGREVGVGGSDHRSLKSEAWATGQTEFSLDFEINRKPNSSSRTCVIRLPVSVPYPGHWRWRESHTDDGNWALSYAQKPCICDCNSTICPKRKVYWTVMDIVPVPVVHLGHLAQLKSLPPVWNWLPYRKHSVFSQTHILGAVTATSESKASLVNVFQVSYAITSIKDSIGQSKSHYSTVML